MDKKMDTFMYFRGGAVEVAAPSSPLADDMCFWADASAAFLAGVDLSFIVIANEYSWVLI